MVQHPISESFEFTGEWAQPGRSKNISGTLRWNGQGATLSLHDTLAAAQEGDSDEPTDYPVLHGTTVTSENITVLDAFRVGTSSSDGVGGYRETERISANKVLVGAHLNAETLYSSMTQRIPGLALWICRSGIKFSQTLSSDNRGRIYRYEVESLPVEKIELKVISSILEISLSNRFSGNSLTDIAVATTGLLTIRSIEPRSLDWLLAQTYKVTSLLALLAGTSMSADYISAITSNEKVSIDVLLSFRDYKVCNFKALPEFFMLRDSMGLDLDIAIQNWFEKYDQIETPCQLALSIFNSEKLWSHIEFLSFMQALEGFHRATMEGLYMSKERYESIAQRISSSIPECVESSHKDALKARIKYGNEISLRKRLADLAALLPESLINLLLGSRVVPSSWVTTRNYYTHWDEASKDAVLNPVQMHYACVRMKSLLRAFYLMHVGLPMESILAAFQSFSKEAYHLAQLRQRGK